MARNFILGWFLLLLVYPLLGSAAFAQDEPPLPEGLVPQSPSAIDEPALPPGLASPPETGGAEEPALPPGLTAPETKPEEEPALPAGLSEEAVEQEAPVVERMLSKLPFELSGFWEARLGFRTQKDPHEKDVSIGETRLQLEAERSWKKATAKVTADFLYDPVLDRHAICLEEGEGFLDLREANFLLTPASFVDLKAGRQILTWGTGDLVFINDLFPKDWNSFFIGRDEEYLKAPSDAVKGSVFTDLANLNVIYTPRFDSDRFIDGRRVSYYNTALGRLAGRDAVVKVDKPEDWFEDDEIAARLYRNIRGYELAVYGYRGFWKSPAGTDPISGRATFPDLNVYGASIRGNISKGIGNIEFAFYDSEDDHSGDDPFIRNGEFRFLVGYEQEVAKDFTVGVQYYLEYMMEHDDYRRTLPAGTPRADEDRHVFTVRLTKLLMSQNLKLSLFTFYSPSDTDVYLRPNIHYKIDDHWSAEIGGNVFIGEDDHTFFGQFKKNTNTYGGVRYSF
jgi:hypothetical protein